MSKNSSNLGTLCRRAAALLATLALLAAMTLPVYAEAVIEEPTLTTETVETSNAPETVEDASASTEPNDTTDTASADPADDSDNTADDATDDTTPSADDTDTTPCTPAGEAPDEDIIETPDENTDGNDIATQPADDAGTADDEATNDEIATYSVTYPIMVYFAVPENFDGSWTVKFNAQKATNGDWVEKKDMALQSKLYDGRKVFGVQLNKSECPHDGYASIQFLYFNSSNSQEKFYEYCKNDWKSADVFANKLFDAKTGQWVAYTPFDQTDHKTFADKTMAFKNANATALTNLVAHFYEKADDGTLQQVSTRSFDTVAAGEKVTFKIPSEACSYIQFTAGDNDEKIGSLYNFYGQDAADGEESFLFDENNRFCFVYSAKASNWTTGEGRMIYYDATFSKVDAEHQDNAIPNASGEVWCHLWVDATTATDVQMTKADASGNLYYANIDSKYTHVIFSNYKIGGKDKGGGSRTPDLDIPEETVHAFPCFYADTSDKVTYTSDYREGYWDTVGQVRNAETGKKRTVVDINPKTFTPESNTKYINSTLYDYYTDWELNGNNRDNYKVDNGPTQQNWVTFRQFDQALSDYYTAYNSTNTENKSVTYPIYTGHFQPNELGTPSFSGVASALNLYGWNGQYNTFMSVNNSYTDINGKNNLAGTNNKDDKGNYIFTFQGLVSDTLNQDGDPTLYNTELAEPHFNKVFLEGKNSKNAVLGKVYENVDFPFTKYNVFGENVDYWYYDAGKKSLFLKQKSGTDDQYFLESPTENNGLSQKSRNVNSSSKQLDDYGFFPFNETSSDTHANTYNYGFGAKLQFQFTLTDDGMVLDKNGKSVPIKFFFSGDDDVWVFIDNDLALDVGGAHSKASGLLEFGAKNSEGNNTYTAYVSNVKAGNSAQSYTDGANKSVTYLGTQISFKYQSKQKTLTPGTHTLTMYYMERGMWESNMAIAFNFPDHNELQVEKQVDVSGVDKLFKDCFKDQKLFNFTIANQATHYGTTLANGDPVKTINLLDPAKSNPTQTNSFTAGPAITTTGDGNVFKKVAANESPGGTPEDTTVLKWYAQYKDLTPSAGSHKKERYGILTLEQPIDIGSMSYLTFDIYVASTEDNASLSNMYLQLQDASGNARGCLGQTFLNGAIYGSVTMKNNEWVTVKLDLSKMKAESNFNNQKVKTLLFGCNYPRYIYLRNIVFSAKAVPTTITGFTTAQDEIADYGSASEGKLMPAKNAQYTSDKESGTMLVDDNGGFVLQDGETITFKDQFRRGSYLSINEQVDKNLYETKWTIFENGQAIEQTNVGNQEKMTLDGEAVELTDRKGTSPDDGRVEKRDAEGRPAQENNAYDGEKPSKKDPDANTLVFRSYIDPDASDANGLTKLKVLFVNKVKTGSLTIYKAQGANSERLDGTYKFKVRFTNVGGHALGDKEITWEVDLKAGESKTLNGIPVGTRFTIEEVAPNDGSKLMDVSITGGGVDREVLSDNTVRGSISGTSTAEATFTNSKQETLDITGTKEWLNADGSAMTDHPTTIYVQLQRRHVGETSEDGWTPVTYRDKAYTPVEQDYDGMKFSFLNLPAKDYSQTDTPNFEYCVVEGYVENGVFRPVESGKTITIGGKVYNVMYSPETVTTGANQSVTITNKQQKPKFTLDIIKKDAENNETLLANVEFTLEKLKDDGGGNWVVDGSFEKRTGVTNEKGKLMLKNANGAMSDIQGFKDLDAGTYRLTETKAAENYNLLSAPILIIFDESGKCQVGDDLINAPDGNIFTGDVHGYKLALTVLNRKTPTLPHTGADAPSLWLLIGLPLAVAGLLILVFRYNKKGGRSR